MIEYYGNNNDNGVSDKNDDYDDVSMVIIPLNAAPVSYYQLCSCLNRVISEMESPVPYVQPHELLARLRNGEVRNPVYIYAAIHTSPLLFTSDQRRLIPYFRSFYG